MQKILLTGGCGAIGREVAERLLLQANIFIVNLDNLSADRGGMENDHDGHPNYRFILGDVANSMCVLQILKEENPHVIFYLAAESDCSKSSVEFSTKNVVSVHAFLETVRSYLACTPNRLLRRIVYLMDDSLPTNPYSASQACAEVICKSYITSHDLPIVFLKCPIVISQVQKPHTLIAKTIEAVVHNQRIAVHGEGRQKHRYIHAYDVVDALLVLGQYGVIGETYHAHCGDELTVLELIQTIVEIAKPGESIANVVTFQLMRPYKEARAILKESGTEKLMALGWRPMYSINEALIGVVQSVEKGLNVKAQNLL